jgi:hypothetical protein
MNTQSLTIERTAAELKSSAYMGHTVLNQKGEKLTWQQLSAIHSTYSFPVSIEGDEMNRIYRIKDAVISQSNH